MRQEAPLRRSIPLIGYPDAVHVLSVSSVMFFDVSPDVQVGEAEVPLSDGVYKHEGTNASQSVLYLRSGLLP